ncbi:ImmA/IrrE family metallo-endopeptidase [Xanthobacter autotrophicus]|uniref:ImmA/IrrE family metallo-endopeptidase n=1 Tax=Xanthobacter autotrophicus TaxID=280 RepID=UPI0037271845
MANPLMQRLSPAEQDIILRHTQSIPVKLSSLARDLGLAVKAATLPAGISGEIRPSNDTQSGYTIRVNRHDVEGRQRFTVAHEIAHYLLHRDKIGTGLTDDALYRSKLTNFMEIEANRFAADLLMPGEAIKQHLSTISGVPDAEKASILAEHFGVSEPAMKIRLGLS